MTDKYLKDMWSKANVYMDIPDYGSSDIQGFIAGSSNSVYEKISRILRLDLGIKLLAAAVFLLESILYFEIQPMVSFICLSGLIFIFLLVYYEIKTLTEFSKLIDTNQSTNEKLTGMLTFLRVRSFITLLSMSSTYLFGFTAAILLYFYADYGELRRIGSLDIYVWPIICFIGIIINYVMNRITIKFQMKHLELCVSDLDEDILPLVSRNIDAQQRRERTTRLLIGIIALLSFVLFVAVLKELGF